MRAVSISLIATVACLVLAPITAQIAGFDPGRPLEENRSLAKPVALPKSWDDAVRAPAEVDDYLHDHFGLRRLSLQIHDKLIWYVLRDSPSPQITRGANGTLFFNSHAAKYPYSLIEQSCGIGLSAAALAPATKDIANFLEQARRINPLSVLVIVPTKAPVYPELLPTWLEKACNGAVPPMNVIQVQLLDERQLAAMVVYPIEYMRSLKARMNVYPPRAFHWSGNMPRLIAQKISEEMFGLTKSREIGTRSTVEHTDLQRFVPGVDLLMEDLEPNYAAAGVKSCLGPTCFPEIGQAAERLGDVSRFETNAGSGKKLLILSDSFGAAIAGWFSEYFSEVWHLNVNDIINNSPGDVDQARLSRTIFVDFAPDRILYLFHDGAVLYGPHQLERLLAAGTSGARQDGAGRR